ncbi:MAG: hypothetical protein LBD60_00230 [Puniceicoccales bacterium]|jgi:hypothetical protein|nr:hypothetical protein [Puniceicoccales bacterium]
MVAAQLGGQLLGTTMGEVGDKTAANADGFSRRWRPRSDEAPKMMHAACQFSDRVFVIADNPGPGGATSWRGSKGEQPLGSEFR